MHDDLIRPPNSVDTTSKSLLKRIKTGDESAWRTLLQIYGPIVAFWTRNGKISHEDSKDIIQEVFAAVARSIDRFERQDGSGKFRRWLKVITQSKISNHYRNSPTEQAVGGESAFERIHAVADPESEDYDVDSAPELSEDENAAIVQGVVQIIQGEFQEHTWRSFWLTAVEGKDTVDVAAELGLSQEAVRKNKSRVMSRLREALATHLG